MIHEAIATGVSCNVGRLRLLNKVTRGHEREVSGQLHAPTALPSGKEPPIITG